MLQAQPSKFSYVAECRSTFESGGRPPSGMHVRMMARGTKVLRSQNSIYIHVLFGYFYVALALVLSPLLLLPLVRLMGTRI
jgi:hypothetical protein